MSESSVEPQVEGIMHHPIPPPIDVPSSIGADLLSPPGVVADEESDRRHPLPSVPEEGTVPIPECLPPGIGAWRPGDDLIVSYCTWNMAQNPPRLNEVREWIRPNSHILAVCTQENGPYIGLNVAHRQWCEAVLCHCLADEYVLVAQRSLWALHVAVYARRADVAPAIVMVETATCSTGELRGLMGNKGGIGVGLTVRMRGVTTDVRDSDVYSPRDDDGSFDPPIQSLPGLRLLFIGAHLTAHQHNIHRRNDDYRTIVQTMNVGIRGPFHASFVRALSAAYASGAKGSRDVTAEYDVTFFGGDLNYRVNGTVKGIERILNAHRDLRCILVFNDQLRRARNQGIVFCGFSEQDLNFKPTYKYAIDKLTKCTQNEYDLNVKKPRQPSYTDRVLCKSRDGSPFGAVSQLLYTDCPIVRTSDHRPVHALFLVPTRQFNNRQAEPEPPTGCCCGS